MASSLSQRQIVLPLIDATKPLPITSAASSSALQRESGTPVRLGNSHARAFTCTTTSGGKNPGAAGSGAFLQSGESFFKEAFAPKAHHIPAGVDVLGNLIIAPPIGGEQHDPGTHDLKIRQRISAHPLLQFAALVP
jgi:hypothetical protein